jgi:UMF1 family MFS transporter
MTPRSEPQLPPQPPLQRAVSSISIKPSYQSHSSSFEADDERSSTADHEMGPEGGFRDDPSQYAGEDTRLTSRKELSGWYAYGFAAEVFVICGMCKVYSFIPLW